jgi:UDP-N-acetylmuramyl pentapeptide phosphotransferase/UDP-N-acetylglucosamine-1-phosphate transferase
VGVTNAINLIDGLDGLAGSLTLTISAILGAYFYMNGNFSFAILAFCLMGAVAGFLRYNITRAIIFMGDTGSLVCGFLVSVMAIQFVELGTVESAPSIAVAILFIPVFDTARIFMIRIMKGQSPFNPDKNHIHHILSRAGLSQLGIVATLVGFNVAVVFYTVGFAYLGDTFLLLSLVGFFVIITAVIAINERLKSSKKQVLNKVA